MTPFEEMSPNKVLKMLQHNIHEHIELSNKHQNLMLYLHEKKFRTIPLVAS